MPFGRIRSASNHAPATPIAHGLPTYCLSISDLERNHAQLLPQQGEPLANTLETLEWCYTIMFTIELACNVIGNVVLNG